MEAIKQEFAKCKTQEELYQAIISLGKKLPPFDLSQKTEENRVQGCQSLMYLAASQKEGKVYFSAFSEAFISAGLAALLIFFYNGKSPEEVLKTPPSFLDDWNIPHSLTPGRANGLSGLILKMRQICIGFLLQSPKMP